jgi:plastocyanin
VRLQPHLLIAALAAAASLTAAPASAATVNGSVKITDTAYAPQVVTIKPGENVTWFNAGTRDHTVTSNSGTQMNTGSIEPGNEVSIRFEEAGTYAYHSAFLRDHLRGIVVVGGQATPDVVTVTVTAPAETPPFPVVSIPADVARRLSTNPLVVRRSQNGDDTAQRAGLVIAAGLTAAAVVLTLVWVVRRGRRGVNETS